MTTALATAASVRAGATSALAETEAAIARIEARDGVLNAVVVRDFDRARAAARELDSRIAAGFDAPLLGVPMTVKESFDVAGLPTTWGFEEHRDFIAETDAVAVTRLKAAGAIILGKTNVPPGLADLQSTNPVYGRTNNPHDPARVSGGSSGGAAVALASGMVPLEIGSDIGGSIRVPSHFCGTWGLKPTYGALSRDGHYWPRTHWHPGPLSVIGPMARAPEDLAASLDVLADIPLPRSSGSGAKHLRILLVTQHPISPVEPAVVAAVEAVGAALARDGAEVETRSNLLPDQAKQFADYMRLLSVTLARGARSPDGIEASLPDWFAMLDTQAQTTRAWERLFERFDAVIAPTLGVPAFEHSDVDIRERELAVADTKAPFGLQFGWPGLATYPNLPATAMPVTTHDGLPIGVQVIGARYRDHDTIAIAKIATAALPSIQEPT
ncbi:amidase family protein [Sphingomonas sp.]|uniref:amidase family protein n=1 Tax=Sphingomonas sp. TaxID=28214 RepID=UPI0035C7FCEC